MSHEHDPPGPTPTPSELASTRAMWARGSYPIVGDWFADASRAAIGDLDLEGVRLLDVACGTGAVAIEAARRGAVATGLDLTPELLAEAARRADASGVVIDLHEGTFTDLSDFAGFDVVTSAFGVVFAADPSQVAAQMADSVAVGGVVSIVGWAPDGAFGSLPPRLIELVPALAHGPDPGRWATPTGVASIFESAASTYGAPAMTVEAVDERTVGVAFESTDAAVWAMRRWSGPWMALFDALGTPEAVRSGHDALVEHLGEFTSGHPRGVQLDAAYTVARLRRN